MRRYLGAISRNPRRPIDVYLDGEPVDWTVEQVEAETLTVIHVRSKPSPESKPKPTLMTKVKRLLNV